MGKNGNNARILSEYYDFNGNGRTDFNDIVKRFREI
jgi:hypothetical protein